MKRTNKRGLDYIDWTLSMGLFLIVVVALFIFIKPGAEPNYSGANLISIVESNFLEETGSVIKETPLFVKKLVNNYGTPTANAEINLGLNGAWKFEDVEPSSALGFDPIVIGTHSMKFDCNFGSCAQNFVISWKPLVQSPPDPVITIDCTPNDITHCEAILGSTTSLEGVEQLWLDALSLQDYAVLKANWNFPIDREFAIFIDNTKLIGGVDPGPQADVFAKEFKYWKINGASRVPAVINLRVW